MSERLTDEELDDIKACGIETGGCSWPDVSRMIAELRKRRAQDLSADDVEDLHIARTFVNYGDIDGSERRRARAVLDKLIAAAEARRG